MPPITPPTIAPTGVDFFVLPGILDPFIDRPVEDDNVVEEPEDDDEEGSVVDVVRSGFAANVSKEGE